MLDTDAFEAAIAELDARYLAGEAAPHAHTWSVIAGGHAAVNRRELPPTTPGCVSIDHRQGTAFAPGELIAYLRAGWDLDQYIETYVEVVHRLSDLGAVYTHAAHGVSHEGFNAEWRGVDLLTVEGNIVNRCEVFDEADIGAALAKFDQLSQPAPQLKNAATRVYERLEAYFAARDWDAITEMLSDDHYSDDRRRIVNAGIRHGRDVEIANMKAGFDVGTNNIKSVEIATRGAHLALSRSRFSGRDQRPEAFQTEVLNIVEIDADERITAFVTFDLDDIDAAIAELDARYVAGEAAAYSHTWSVIAQAYAALNRRRLSATTPDWRSIDHRRFGTVEANALTANIRAWWDITSEARINIEAVHRLTDFGAVITHATHATWQEGVGIESREISILMVDGDRINRCELFDEADLDTALARFRELHPQTRRRLENTASQVDQRFWRYFPARDWDAMAEILSDDFSLDDRRQVLSAGIRQGRDTEIENLKVMADVIGGVNITSNAIATRGKRLALRRLRFSGQDQEPEAFYNEMLGVVEINADSQLSAHVVFDPDDIGAAFDELDARYLAGEAAVHARTWSAIARAYAGFNRGEIPATTQDWVNIDHRHAAAMAPGEGVAYFRASWELAADLSVYIQAVHGLSDLGAVFTHVGKGISREGFEAEWRTVDIMTVEGDLITRAELFDEADIDGALAKFDELDRPTPRLETAASQAVERLLACFPVRDWEAMAEMLPDDFSIDDRRRTVNAGVRHGRDAEIEDLRAAADVGFTKLTSTVIVTRGERLFLTLIGASGRDPEAIQIDALQVVEIDAEGRIAAVVVFDPETSTPPSPSSTLVTSRARQRPMRASGRVRWTPSASSTVTSEAR